MNQTTPFISNLLLNAVDQGVIYVSKGGCIEFCNDKAKEIIGLKTDYTVSHAEGRIEKGDIVCIASNSLDADKENLSMETLKKLGYKDKSPFGVPFILIGRYDTDEAPIYHLGSTSEKQLLLHKSFNGKEIQATIDFEHKSIDIAFDGVHYRLNYVVSIDHMLLVNKDASSVKFYQSKGFTTRHETLDELLNGITFRTKDGNTPSTRVIGSNLSDILKQDEMFQEVMDCAKGIDTSYTSQFRQINGLPTLCSLIPVKQDGLSTGALLKIEDITELYSVISERNTALRQLKDLESSIIQRSKSKHLLPEIIGTSEAIDRIKSQGYKASLSTSTVLLLGESGTGKSFMAYAIHRASDRKEAPFIHVNCSSIPAELLESELFGYEKGAFTGAKHDGKMGLFQKAHMGTIFLDEIGEIDYKIQSKLLKVLQDKTFYKVGGTKELSVDVRVIAATNKDLKDSVKQGHFRQDLFYRINVFPIVVPPLRSRRKDIEALTDHLIPKICGRLNMPTKTLSTDALFQLKNYDFPGNVRELENILERSINLSFGTVIQIEDIHLSTNDMEKPSLFKPLKDYVNDTERRILEEALSFYQYDKKKVMEALAIKKTTFYDRVKKYDLELFENTDSVRNRGK